MRYTRKVKQTPIYDCDYESKVEEKGLLDKLGKLEDIEEALGIDLFTFVDALERGIYVKVNGTIKKCYHPILTFDDDLDGDRCYERVFECNDIGGWVTVYLKDYGVTWALTKEELKLL